MPLGFDRLHLKVRHRGHQFGIPVHQALATIDQALLVQAHEGFNDTFRHLRIHREVFTRPVGRGTEASYLAGNGAT